MIAIIVFVLVLSAVLCFLEYVLAKRENPLPGRVLIILWAVVSVLVFLWMVYNFATHNGGFLNLLSGMELGLLLTAFAVLLAMNIPTVLCALVYRFTRKKFADKREIDKMAK